MRSGRHDHKLRTEPRPVSPTKLASLLSYCNTTWPCCSVDRWRSYRKDKLRPETSATEAAPDFTDVNVPEDLAMPHYIAT